MDNKTNIKSTSTYGINNTSDTLVLSDGNVYGINNSGVLIINENSKIHRGDNVVALSNTNITNINGGEISDTSENILIRNSSKLNINDGLISSSGKAIDNHNGTINGKGGLINSSKEGIDSGEVVIDGIRVESTDESAIKTNNVTVKSGLVKSENNIAINAYVVDITGGTITSINSDGVSALYTANISGGEVNAKNIGVYGNEINITDGTINSLDIGIQTYDRREYYNTIYGTVNIEGGTVNGKDSGIITSNINMTGGTVNSSEGIGVTVTHEGTIVDGVIKGEIYGLLNKSKVTLGTDDTNIISTKPILIGGSYGLYIEENKETNFYDGILKGTIDGYYGLITTTPLGAITLDGEETIEDILYQTDTLIVYENWLRVVGGSEYNTIDAASSAINGTEGTIEVIRDVDDISFKQLFINTNSDVNITFDLNGHTIRTIQPIHNTLNVTIIDSSEDKTGTLKPIRNSSIINDETGKLTLNGGNYLSNIEDVIANDGEMIVENARFNVDNTAITNNRNLTINNINIEKSKIGIYQTSSTKHSSGLTTLNGGSIKSSDIGISLSSTLAQSYNVVVNDGNIISNKDGISGATGSVEINGGSILAKNGYGIYDSGSGGVTVNGGTITSDNGIGVYETAGFYMTGGTIIGKTYGVKNGKLELSIGSGSSYTSMIVTDGHIIGQTIDGLNSGGGQLIVTGGVIEGQNDGVYTAAHTTIGNNENPINIETPILIGHTKYGLETTNYTEFYDGILKGIPNGYRGLINLIPDGSLINEDYEYINRVEYQTRYLVTKDNWLEVDGQPYNSLNAAYQAIQGNEGTILVTNSAYVDFKQKLPSGKKVTLNLQGHNVIFTNNIVIENDTTIIDTIGYGSFTNLREEVFVNNGTLTIDTGNYDDVTNEDNEAVNTGLTFLSEMDNTIVNNGTLNIKSGKLKSETGKSIVNNSTFNMFDGYILTEENNTSESVLNEGQFTMTGGTIKGINNTAITNNGTFNLTDGYIESKSGIDNKGKVVINGGVIKTTNGVAIKTSSETTINNGTIDATAGACIENRGNNLTINDGTIKSNTHTCILNIGNEIYPAKAYINGGDITGKINGINNNYYDSLSISGGTIKGIENVGVYTSGKADIAGGLIEGNNYGVHTNGVTTLGSNDQNVLIDKPVLKGDIYGLYIESGTLNFYDGILKGIEDRWNGQITQIPENAEIKLSDEVIDDNTYLTAFIYVETDIAKNINTNKIYNNIQKAINEANNNEEIELLRDAPIYYEITNDKNIILNLNGYELTTNKVINNSGILNITEKNNNDNTYNTNNPTNRITTSSIINLLTNSNELLLSNITLKNENASKSVVYNTGKVTTNNLTINSKYGIYSDNELNINNSTFNCAMTAIENYGSLNIVGGNYSGSGYTVYSKTNEDVLIDSVTISGSYYNEGNNVAIIKDSNVSKQLQNITSKLEVQHCTIDDGVANRGNIKISNSNINNGITNNNESQIYKTNITNKKINNSGNMIMDESIFSTIGGSYSQSNLDRLVNNSGTLVLNKSRLLFNTSEEGRNTNGIYNNGVLNINNESKISMGNGSTNYRYQAIYNYGDANVNIDNSEININGGSNSIGIYNDSENTNVKIISGKVEVKNSINGYGVYDNFGTFEMGTYDGSGLQIADVSNTDPYIYAQGSTLGIGIKKINGFFNYYDGIIWGSRYSKPETTTNVEYKYEATTYVNQDNGYEYTILEWMPNDYQGEAVAQIGTSLHFNTISEAIEHATDGDIIKILRGTTEDLNIPEGKAISIDLNKKSVTSTITNNGTLNIYNGTLNNVDNSVIINNGTLILGNDDGNILSSSPRIVSEENSAIVNNGTFIFYDGLIEGREAINGSIDRISELARVRTIKNQQSEKKYLQSLSEESILSGETDLIITIDPNTGYYDNLNRPQEIFRKHGETYTLYDVSDPSGPRKNGCDFDGWEISDDDVYSNGTITMDISDINIKAKWKVKDTTVAQIGTEYYDTLADAIFHAKENDTIILLKDTEEDITNNKNITIQLNKHTVTGAFINKGDLKLIDGTIKNPDGIGLVNTKSLTIGILDKTIPYIGNIDNEEDSQSVRIIGTTLGLQNDGRFIFYDGYIEGAVALNGKVDDKPQGYFVYTESNVENPNNILQRLYLIGKPDNAVAETRENGVQYFFNLNDAIKTSELTGYTIYIRKNFTANYNIEVSLNKNIEIDMNGYEMSTSKPFIVNGNLKLFNSSDNKASILTNNIITNNGNLNINNIDINETNNEAILIDNKGILNINKSNISSKVSDTILNSSELNINNSVISNKEGYAVNNIGDIKLSSDSKLVSDKYALYQDSDNLILDNGTIYGIYQNKKLELKDNINIISNSGYHGILVNTTDSLIVDGGSINSNDDGYAIYSNIDNTNINIKSGIIEGVKGIYNKQRTSLIITGGSIDVTDNAIHNDSVADIKITNGKIISKEKTALSNETTLGYDDEDSSNIEINDSYLESKIETLNLCHTHLITSNTTIKSNSEDVNRYAISACNNNTNIILGENTEVLSPSASGVWGNNIVLNKATIKASADNSIGISGYMLNLEINDSKIETPGSSAIGISHHSSYVGSEIYNVTINGGEIKSGNIGISNTIKSVRNDKELNINSGNIIGNNYGIYQDGNYNINMGNKNEEVSISKPYVTGGLYGVYKTSGRLNFYNGKVRGETFGYNSINTIRNGMTMYTDYTEYNDVPEGTIKYISNYLTNQENFLKVGNETFNNFESAIEALNEDNKTIYLIKDIENSSEFIIPDNKNVIFDINGHSIVFKTNISNNGNLEITNSSSEGNITSEIDELIINKVKVTLNGVNVTSLDGTIIKNIEDNSENIITNNTSITSKVGIISNKKSKISLISSNINTTSTSIDLIDAIESSLEITNSNIISSESTIIVNKANITMNSGNIKGYNTAIDGRYESSDIVINNGTIQSERNNTITNCNVTLNDGTIKSDSDYAIYNGNEVIIKKGSVISQNSNAIASNGDVTILGGKINSVGSAISSRGTITISGGEIRTIGNNTAINCNGYNCNLKMTDGIITSKGNGVNLYNYNSKNSSISGGIIRADKTGIVINNNELEITGGTITGKEYGISVGNSATLNLGSSIEPISTETPLVSGGSYGVYNRGTFNFYSGRMQGTIFGYDGQVNKVTSKKQIYTDSEISNVDIYKTISTDNVSNIPTSYYAKEGNGYAKITYLGNDSNCNNLVFEKDFTGEEEIFNVTCDGRYKLEVWGAQGGNSNNGIKNNIGGYGAYSKGEINLSQGDTLYINVGGAGESNCNNKVCLGGYNGGGSAGWVNETVYNGGGGGATSIATKSGLLSSLENDKDKIIIVAGGGGGSTSHDNNSTFGFYHDGGSGGGYEGTGACSDTDRADSGSSSGCGGTQEGPGGVSDNYYGTIGSFGQGASNSLQGSISGQDRKYYAPGAGGGYYGGSTGTNGVAGGGSGYVNSDLEEAIMYGYHAYTGDNMVINYLTKLDGFLEVNGTIYDSLSEAIAAIDSEGTINVLNSKTVTDEPTIPSDKNITINLSNNEITLNKAIINNGTLKVISDTEEKGALYQNSNLYVITNNGNLEIENVYLKANGTYSVIRANKDNGTIDIKNSKLETANVSSDSYDIYVTNNQNITITDSEFISKNTYNSAGCIGINSNNNNIIIKNSILDSTQNGVYVYSGANSGITTINKSTINASRSGINCSASESFVIKDSTINQTSSSGSNAIYAGNIEIDNVDINSNSSGYAIYCGNSNNCDIKNSTIISTDSGIYNFKEIVNTNVTSVSDGVYLNKSNLEVNIDSDSKITTTGTSSKGIVAYNGTINVNGATITSNNIGAYTTSYGVININSGTINGSNYGLSLNGSSSIINIGSNDNEVSISNPNIFGDTYAINKTSGKINFYSGVVEGKTGTINGDYTLLRDSYMLKSEILRNPNSNTYNTEDAYANATSNKAKKGNGYARITYVNDDAVEEDPCNMLIGEEYSFYSEKEAQQFVAECSGNYKVELWGAQGGNNSFGGKGAYTSGIINLSAQDSFYVYVGNSPENSSSGSFNGVESYYSADAKRGSGGGATDIRLVNGDWNNQESLASRIMVAGAGGGSYGNPNISYSVIGGAGGSLIGKDGNIETGSSEITPPTGGTQTTGGVGGTGKLENGTAGLFGKGAKGGTYREAGGGGYYGGGSGSVNNDRSTSGAGGSSYVSGYKGSVAIKSATDLSPRNDSNGTQCTMESAADDVKCSEHYSGLVFSNAIMIAGDESMPTHSNTSTMIGNSGNGFAKITYLGDGTEISNPCGSQKYSFTGEEETFTATCSGKYKLEVWGAQGGVKDDNHRGGYGGYSTGTITLSEGEKLYVNVGGQGSSPDGSGGYNGGGKGGSYGGAGGGGGATHIATSSGLLSSLENNKDSVVIVAGGGGGYASYNCSTSIGGSGGGDLGSPHSIGGTQFAGGPTTGQTGGSFGKGGYQSNTINSAPGAGAGWYGGGTSSNVCVAGGGSGYVGNTRLKDKMMYQYDSPSNNIYRDYLVLSDKYIHNLEQDKWYNNINDAISEANSGDTLQFNSNRSESIDEISSTQDITLDINGNNIYINSELINKGTLTITDSVNNSPAIITTENINNTGTLNINNANLELVGTSITNNSTMNINSSTLETASSLINNKGTLNIDNGQLTSNGTTITNSNILSINSSNINGKNYALYTSGNATKTINESSLESSSTALGVANSTTNLSVEKTDLDGVVSIGNGAVVSIIGDPINKNTMNNNSSTAITFRGTVTVKNMKINNLVNIYGNLNIEDSEIERNVSSNSNYWIFEVYSGGNITSKGNTYTISNSNSSGTLGTIQLKANNNLISTNDTFVVNNGNTVKVFEYYSEVVQAIVDNATIKVNNSSNSSNSNVTIIENASSNDISINNSTININNDNEISTTIIKNSGVISVNNTTSTINTSSTSNGIDMSSGTINIDNSTFNIKGTTSNGIKVTDGTVNIKSGTFNVTGTDVYGINMTNGTITLGIKDQNVSITNPLINAIGTTNGIGITYGQGIFNYYDGKIIGSTSARINGEVISDYETNYHVEDSFDSTNNNYYCILKYDY